MTLLQLEPEVATRSAIKPEPPTDASPATDARPAIAPGPSTVVVPTALTKLRAVLLLAGTVRCTPFTAGIGRSVLDLPWDGERTILDVWLNDVADFARQIGWERPRVNVLIDQRCVAPAPRASSATSSVAAAAAAAVAPVETVIRRDRTELRGAGGLLYDVAEVYDDDDYLLVAHAAQILREPLANAVLAVAADGGDVGLMAHRDGSPVSLWLVRCGSLRRLPAVGYVDFMEQGLPRIAEAHRVTVSLRGESTGLPLRTERDYLAALRWHYRRRRLGPAADDPLAEDWEPLFRLVEPGAAIDPSADVFNSVILRGARVEAGATVVRSVLCPGAVVRRGQHAVDQLVGGGAHPANATAAAALAGALADALVQAPAQGRGACDRPAVPEPLKLGTSRLAMP